VRLRLSHDRGENSQQFLGLTDRDLHKRTCQQSAHSRQPKVVVRFRELPSRKIACAGKLLVRKGMVRFLNIGAD
jgi:hypothetical protein